MSHLMSFSAFILKMLSGSSKLLDSMPNPDVAMESNVNLPNISLASRTSPVMAAVLRRGWMFAPHLSM